MCVNLQFQVFKRPKRSFFGLRYGFVPCGKCSECRSSMHDSWSFRLMAETDYRVAHGWQVGFFTLTYKDKRLPCSHLVNRETGALELVAHFWKPHVQELLQKVRKKLWKWHKSALKKDNLTLKDSPFVAPKWLVASEYGGRTARPHYHGIVLIPPSIEPWKVHYLIKRYWRKNGFIIPKDFEGGPKNKPFICSSWKNACWYAGKYCCKDIGHECLIANYEIDSMLTMTEDQCQEFWRNMRSFHVQSRGLGRCFIEGRTDSDLLKLLEVGFAFDGDSYYRHIPLYYKNKLFYSPDYIYCQGRRLVRRKATEFFKRNYKALYRLCVKQYTELFTNMLTKDYWSKFRYSSRQIDSILSASKGFSPIDLAQFYVAYYGVPRSERYSDRPEIQFLSRYTHHKYSFCGDKPILDNDALELAISSLNKAVCSRFDFEHFDDEIDLQTIKHAHLTQ